ncbi:MAG: hypothetical protein ABEJ86_08140 [Halococcoides sp.]
MRVERSSAIDALGTVVGLAAVGTVLAFVASLVGVPTGGPAPEVVGLAALVVGTLAGATRSRLQGERTATGLYLFATGGLITFALAPADSLLEWTAVAGLGVAGVALLAEGLGDD